MINPIYSKKEAEERTKKLPNKLRAKFKTFADFITFYGGANIYYQLRRDMIGVDVREDYK